MAKITNLDQLVIDIAKHNDIPEDKVRVETSDWASALMRNGMIVDLRMSRWRATTSMDPEEMGVDSHKEFWTKYCDKYARMGNKTLLPKDVLKSFSNIENKARRNLRQFSIPTLWGAFVPHTAFAKWKKSNDEIREEYMAERDMVADSWTKLSEEVINDYETYMNKIYSGNENGLSKIPEMLLSFRKQIINPDLFRSSFVFDTVFSFIPVPSMMERDIQEKKQISIETSEMESEQEMKDILRDEFAAKQTEYIDSFLSAASGEISDHIQRTVKQVRRAIGNNGDRAIKGGVRKSLNHMVSMIRDLNFFDDQEIKKALDKLEIDLNRPKDKRDIKDIAKDLDAIEMAGTDIVSSMLRSRMRRIEM